jgi:hypothetical protein
LQEKLTGLKREDGSLRTFDGRWSKDLIDTEELACAKVPIGTLKHVLFFKELMGETFQ